MKTQVPACVLLAVLLLPAAAQAQGEQSDKLRGAKAMFFDKEYAAARSAWQAIARGSGREAQTALYWIARCSESLGESERALGEYEKYLASRPSDRTLAEEARTSRVGLAIKLAKGGRPDRAAIAREALSDSSRTVRYFTALQLSTLGPDSCRPAIPVLKDILGREADDDLVERAKLALLRCDPGALAESSEQPLLRRGASRQASWIRVRIYEKGAAKPNVSVNLPVGLAEMVFKSLPDETRQELRKKGYDSDNFWERLKSTGPTDILSIEGDDGERVQVWIE